jgi:hypothetical protein
MCIALALGGVGSMINTERDSRRRTAQREIIGSAEIRWMRLV